MLLNGSILTVGRRGRRDCLRLGMTVSFGTRPLWEVRDQPCKEDAMPRD